MKPTDITVGATEVLASVHLLNFDGTPALDITSATTGVSITIQVGNGNPTTFSPLPLPVGSWVELGIRHVANGRYLVAVPDSYFAAASSDEITVLVEAPNRYPVEAVLRVVPPIDAGETLVELIREDRERAAGPIIHLAQSVGMARNDIIGLIQLAAELDDKFPANTADKIALIEAMRGTDGAVTSAPNNDGLIDAVNAVSNTLSSAPTPPTVEQISNRIERADSPLVTELGKVKKVNERIKHTRVASVEGVSDTVIETRE